MHSSDIGLRRFYHLEVFSDVIINIPEGDEVYAHKVVLAAGSGYFRRELMLPKYNVSHHGD